MLCINHIGPFTLRRLTLTLFIGALLSACQSEPVTGNSDLNTSNIAPSDNDKRPNILLIVADDLGYGDVGAHGSEIETPNINALANQGSRFTSFYTQASCSPTRAMLLTGVDNHRNGMGTMAEDLLPHHKNLPGYVGYLNKEVVTVASLLQDAGYHTYMSGKWHLGYEQGLSPYDRGFAHTFALLEGGGNHFNEQPMNAFKAKSTYQRNGKVVSRPEGFSSDLFAEEMQSLIGARLDDGKPFFAYLAFTAPHFPLQAPKAFIDKYKGKYSQGWDKLRAQRFERMQALGLVTKNAKLPAGESSIPKWSDLSTQEQKTEARKMAIYAAMIDNMDMNIGKVSQYLKDRGEYDNTVIIFISDNGPDPYDRIERKAYADLVAKYNYDQSYQNMGAANSYLFMGPGWAQASSVHQSDYKFLPTQGGIRNTVFMRFPGLSARGQVMSEFASILDITPTLLELADVTHPGTKYKGRKVYPLNGRSMLPYLSGESKHIYADDEAISFELFGNAAVFMGNWKAVKVRAPFRDGQWRLYNISLDASEQQDLSKQQPKKLRKMLAAYADYKQQNGVIDEPDEVTAYPRKPHYVKHLTE